MNVFIAASSSNNIDSKYLTLAREVSKILTKRNLDLVFGGASFSMMGECYHAFTEEGRDVEAFTVEKYKADLEGLPKANPHLVSDTLVRFKWMYDLSDIILILPGGIGTLAEFSSALEEYRADNKRKLILIYNYDGFYDKILDWMKDTVKNKFINEDLLKDFKVIENHEELIEQVDEFLEVVEDEIKNG